MDDYISTYTLTRLENCQKALVANNFTAYIAADTVAARELILNTIIPPLGIRTASWGDSLSMLRTGIIGALADLDGVELIRTFDDSLPQEEITERRRQALLADLFLTGSNAVTEDGKLVNLDMVGNRVAGITFGPKHVVLVIGRNKIVPSVDDAMTRIKDIAAPLNAMRHSGLKTPCMKTTYCADCKSPDRICNTWTITEKCFPKGRIHVILVNQDLGL